MYQSATTPPGGFNLVVESGQQVHSNQSVAAKPKPFVLKTEHNAGFCRVGQLLMFVSGDKEPITSNVANDGHSALTLYSVSVHV